MKKRMKIKIKNGQDLVISFENYFKSINELIKFITIKNKFINPEQIIFKTEMVYNNLIKSNEEIKGSLLVQRILQEYGFKYKRPVRLEFWEERGFGIKEFNKYNSNSKIGNNQFRAKENIGSLNLIEDENQFEYGNFIFKNKGIPKCNLCKFDISVSPSINKYVIKECTNKNCATHKNENIITIKQLAFLPIEIFENKNKRIHITSKIKKEYWLLKGYSYEDSLKKVNEIKNQTKNLPQSSKEYYEIVYDLTEKEALDKIKTGSILSKNYWINKGYTEDYANFKINLIQKNNSLKFIEKKKLNPLAYTAVTTTQIGYWINNGLSEVEAKEKIKIRQQTFSLEKCIEKHGEKNGIEIFNNRQSKWLKSLNENGNLIHGHSKVSQELFYNILDFYPLQEKHNVYFATKNEEFLIKKNNGGILLYDFTDIKKKKIIEFNGDIFHGNPNRYLSTDFPNPFKKHITALEMWEKDEKKIKFAYENGYEVMIIWESEYRKQKEQVLKKCLEFLEINLNNNNK